MGVNRRGFLRGLAGAAAIVASRLVPFGNAPADLYIKGATFVGKYTLPAGARVVLERCLFLPNDVMIVGK